MFYDYLGSGNYKITLKVYRDATQFANFDGTAGSPIAYLNIFDNTGSLVQQVDLGAPVVSHVPISLGPCVTPPNILVDEGVYTITLNLPTKAGGYTLVYQRCCRNAGVANLSNSVGQGASYTAFIPGPELAPVNSSPRFTNFPPICICNNLALNFNHSATDADGDSLVYSFCSPFTGLDGCCPSLGSTPPPQPVTACQTPPPSCPTIPPPPPYAPVVFVPPFSSNYPVASNPSLTINSITGLLQGLPNLLGLYVVGVCVEEYRNGILLSKHYRDFQFNVEPCVVTVVAAVASQTQVCQGLTINFKNQSIDNSVTPKYHWDFGDTTIISDTSNIFNPTYTYQDTGIYNLTLIVNPGELCTDTLKKKVYVYPPLSINFSNHQVYCVKSNSVNFNAVGIYLPICKFSWDFTSMASPNTSTLQNPTNIHFTQAGLFFIKLIGHQYACVDTFIDSIRVLGRPTAKINNFPTRLCDPGTVSFSNGSISEYPSGYVWTTSDGASYSSYEPTHVFTPDGVYGATLTLIRNAPCPDTSLASINTITINPTPHPNFIFTPSVTTIFDPEILFVDSSSSDVVSWRYDFGDGGYSTFVNDKHTYQAPGTYGLNETVTNGFGCVNHITKEITILPEFRFWIPNTFTPDDNGLNDVFMPVAIGVTDFKFYIFDRWGQKIFTSTDTSKGWDGKFNGKLCKQDIYAWKITYTNDVTKKPEIQSGHITLLSNMDGF